MARGTCRICGCTWNNPCYNPKHGTCWWVDDTHELCSHCADRLISEDSDTRHCINSGVTELFPGIERKDLAALGCPFPDSDAEMCIECRHRSILFGTCDLGIAI